MQLRITGAPFTPIWAWYGTVLHAPSLGIPIQFQLDGSSSMSLGAWILGFDGSLQFPLALPNSPGLVGQTIAIQVIGFAGGSPQASLPALLVVGG
jgi:hypothetical protein